MTCPKCGDTGLIPFVNSSGKVISNAWVYCSCVPYPEEHYHDYELDDFDFPCSRTFRNYYSELCGEPVQQASDTVEEMKQPELVQHHIVYEHSDMSEQNLHRLGNAEGQIKSLKQLLNQMQARRKPRGEF